MADIPVKEIGQLLDEVSGKVPKLVNGLLDTIYSPEAGKKMGQSIGNFYNELVLGGIPKEEALKLAKDYMLSIKDIPGSVLNASNTNKMNFSNYLAVKGITCENCEKAVKTALEGLGAQVVSMGPLSGIIENDEIKVEYDEQSRPSEFKDLRIVEVSHELTEQALIDCIKGLGYESEVIKVNKREDL